MPEETGIALGKGVNPSLPVKGTVTVNGAAVEMPPEWRNLMLPTSKIKFFFGAMGENAPKGQAIVSCPFEDFEFPRELKGGKTPLAKWIEIVGAVVGFNGSMYDAFAENGEQLLVGDAKAMAKFRKKLHKGPEHAAAYLKADAAKGAEPGGRCDVVNKQVIKFRVEEDDEGNQKEYVQFLISANLFMESRTPVSDEEHERNLAKFDPNSELFEYQSANPKMVPNEMFKFKAVATDEDVKWYTALRENSRFGSATFYGSLQVSFVKLYPYFARDRILLQLYLEKVHAICVVGSSSGSLGGGKSESIASNEQRESMKRMFAVATGETFDDESGGGSAKKSKLVE